MGCCGHFSALFRSKNGVGLTVFPRLSSRHQGRVRRRSAGSLLELFVEILLAFFFFLPCREVKLLLDCRGRGGEKKTNGEENKGPSFEGPGLQLSHMSYSPTMRGNHSEGNGGRAQRTHNKLKMQQAPPSHFAGVSPPGEGSSPTSSPRCEFAASVIFTQIRIYRVNIDDRSSASGCTGPRAAASFIFNQLQILKR